MTLSTNAQRPGRGTRGAAAGGAGAEIATVLLPNRSPLVTFRILFMTGAASDPQGKEGVAALTASLLSDGGTRARSYEQLVEAVYPMGLGSPLSSQIDKEMTVFSVTTHADNLERHYALIREMLLEPGFRPDDFTRLRTNAVNFLKVNLREGNDEELGKERLYNLLYQGHPYEHHNVGRVGSLEKLTAEDVRAFYRDNYTRANLVIGLSGGYPADFPARVEADFAKLPAGKASAAKFAAPKLSPGMKIELVKRETRATALSLGFPISVNRSHKDWAALAVVASYFGQHRSSNSYLYQRLREARGLNYGDYSYIEYFPRGMFQFTPDANLGRQTQIFQIWIRPVEPQNGHFVLRAALYEFDKLVREGLSREAFEGTRAFLVKYNNILTQTQDAQLGYALDSRYYKTGDYVSHMRAQLASLTLEEVNAALRRHLDRGSMRVVVITKDAEALRDAILKGAPSPMTYNSPKPEEILREDKVIQTYKIDVKPADVSIVPVGRVFE
jgi:zinc protease